jgi:hypothetical protein
MSNTKDRLGIGARCRWSRISGASRYRGWSGEVTYQEAQRRGLLPAVVGEVLDGPVALDEAGAAIEEQVQLAAAAFRQARLAEG